MAKEPQKPATVDAATDQAPAWFGFIRDFIVVKGLGSRGDRRGLEGSVKFDLRSIPSHIAELLIREGIESELQTASTAAERERDKLVEAGKMDEAAAYSIGDNALRFMQARIEKWQAGDYGRTRGMTDPVEARAQKIATDRFVALVALGKLKGVPANAKLNADQKAKGRDLLLASAQGEAIRATAREQLAEEARRAKEAASVADFGEMDLGSI